MPDVVFRNRSRFAAIARMASSWQCACLKVVLHTLFNQKERDRRCADQPTVGARLG